MLKELIDKFYLDRQKNKKEQTSFYISEAGKCPRQVFFKFKNAPGRDLEPNILRLFDHGEHMHQLIMKPLLSTRDIHIVASEVDIAPGQIVRGRADAIISDGKDLYVLDIKSMNSMIFGKLEEPKEENINQLQLYLYFFRIPRGILLYVDKDKLNLKEFSISLDKKRVKSILDNLSILKEKIESNIVPTRIPEYPGNWQCRFCAYRNVCDTSGSGEVNWNDFKKQIELGE